jgi:diaminohydroxyphosphoribosylaminopyrimidine deaminase / 5-amino-6-(5-phosphoribosylamino)uracil reductase
MRDNLKAAFCLAISGYGKNVCLLLHTPMTCYSKSRQGKAGSMQSTQQMQRALTLSEKGYGLTYPNPIVGAVITDPTGEVIGEGFHQRQISPDHAEIVAIKSTERSLKGATMYVTLEPCNHTGTTPPCTQAIIDAEFARVVISTRDPHEVASGGVEKLRAAGIDVDLDVLGEEVQFSNRSWLHKIHTGRPRMIWKVAQSADGKIAIGNGSPTWVSSEEARADVQNLRAQSDAILIGTGTALADNPHLIPRNATGGMNPDRIVVGMRDIPASHNLNDSSALTHFVKSRNPQEIVSKLSSYGYNQVLLECGPTLGNVLVGAGFIDELIIYRSPISLGAAGVQLFEDEQALLSKGQLMSQILIGPDTKSHYFITKMGG